MLEFCVCNLNICFSSPVDATSNKDLAVPRSPTASASAAATSAAAGRAQSTASRTNILYRDIKQLLETTLDRCATALITLN
jgi:hypothetical protein